ncbi:MAG: YaeQ family protein, partial [Bdellovibrionales bacterium]|nr:YaeQ family protein [Bdellovibrionales bacterium]
DLPYLLGRVLTFCHLADSTVQFSEGLFNLKLPTILATNELGNLSRWVQVGPPSAKKLKRALNLSPQPDIRVYFTNSDEVQQFTHELRGSKQNWIKEVSFLQFEDGFLELLAEEVGYCPDWAVTFIDESVYINVDNRDFHAGLTQIDIWHEYQKALRTHS